MMEEGQPCQVTVIVYSAKGLQAHKRADVCQASVVFGHGKDFYTTEVVDGSTPEWNQEASMSISSHFHEPIRFKVKDREHTLGSVTVALAGLKSSPERLWLPLQPHKRAHEAHGSLQLSCWVAGSGNSAVECFPARSSDEKETQEGVKGGVVQCTPEEEEEEEEEEEGAVPEVTGVSPNKGPVQGGQRVVLRGSFLGESREDVVQVLVAGVDCTCSLEYFSPSKLAVVTAPRAAPGSGPVVVHTKTGGVGVSWINFSFIVEEEITAERPKKANNDVSEAEALRTELASYRQQVRELKERNKSLCEENEQLRGYIDKLLLGVLDHSPGVLEIKTFSESLSLRHSIRH